MVKSYTFKEMANDLLKTGKIRYEITSLGASRDTGLEVTYYEVRLQGNLISTQADSFEYYDDGSADHFPDPAKVLGDLTNVSVYGCGQTVSGFIGWVQDMGWEDKIAPFSRKERVGVSPKYTLDQIKECWDAEWAMVKKLEDALGADVLEALMIADR